MRKHKGKLAANAVVFVVAVAVAAVIAYSISNNGNGLHFSLVGKTASVQYYGGTIRAESSGFTPMGEYQTLVWGPETKNDTWPRYKYPVFNGWADVYGRASTWSWNGGGAVSGSYAYGYTDSPGRYKVVVVDLSTGRATDPVYFTVEPNPLKKS